MYPILNPSFHTSHGMLEDDYVLVKILGDDYKPKEIKEKLVRIKESNSKVIRKVNCIEGEWCPTFNGFTFVQSGHAWVSSQNSEGYAVIFIKVPLALIEGTVEGIVLQPDRIQFIN